MKSVVRTTICKRQHVTKVVRMNNTWCLPSGLHGKTCTWTTVTHGRMWWVPTVSHNDIEVPGKMQLQPVGRIGKASQRRWVQTSWRMSRHWTEKKDDHPERRSNKKKSMTVEGNLQEPRAVSFVCIMGVHGNRAWNAELRSFQKFNRRWAASCSFETR